MPSKPLLPRVITLLAALALAGVVMAAPLENRSLPSATDGSARTDRNITRVTARVLEEAQFAHKRLDDALAATFLERYLAALDPAHLVFLQSDVRDFDAYRAQLPVLTRRDGDSSPAHAIFQRYLERLHQRVAYITHLLQSTTFDFGGHDTYSFAREHASRPVDLQAAQELWQQHVRAEYLQEKLTGTTPGDIVATLTRRYTRLAQAMTQFGSEDILELYLDALAHVYDPHSDYLGSVHMDDFSTAMRLSLFGIGATLRADDGYATIAQLVPGGPAARSGVLKPGDRIVAVGQGEDPPVDIVDLPLQSAVKLIRGPKGTPVRLTLLPVGVDDASVRTTITLVRDEITLEDQHAKARIMDLPQSHGTPLRLGIIDLASFYGGYEAPAQATPSSATADVARLLRKLQAEHIHGLILDVRHNGGGALDEAIALTGLFIREGPVVQTRARDGRIDVGADTEASELYEGPLIVLTSRFSASASEILAGALQDYGRAVIVGDTSTFGKGTVQTVMPLARIMDQNHLEHAYDPGALKITTRKFYRPSGASTQLQGVAADIALPSFSDAAGVGEAALHEPLPWDRIPSADFVREDHVSPVLPTLRAQSAARLAEDKDFAYLREDIALMQQNLATKTVSLNEAERRQDMATAQAREAARQQERAARHETQPITYDITLKHVDTAGLPVPASTARTPMAALTAPSAEAAESAEASVPPGDPVLSESLRILADFVSMRHRVSTGVVTGP